MHPLFALTVEETEEHTHTHEKPMTKKHTIIGTQISQAQSPSGFDHSCGIRIQSHAGHQELNPNVPRC